MHDMTRAIHTAEEPYFEADGLRCNNVGGIRSNDQCKMDDNWLRIRLKSGTMRPDVVWVLQVWES